MRLTIIVVSAFAFATVLGCLPGAQSVEVDPNAAPTPTPIIDPTTGKVVTPTPIIDPTTGLEVTFTPTSTPTLTPTTRPTRTPRPARTPSPTVTPTVTPVPGIITTLKLDGNSTNVTVSGDFAFVSAIGAGIHVVDVSEPGNPELVTTIPGSPDDLVASGDVLLVVEINAENPLKAYDISNPASPREVAVPAGISATQFAGVDAEEGLAVVSGGTSNMSVLDISDVDQITLVGSLPKDLGFADVTVSQGKAFISSDVSGDPRYGVLVYDLSDPSRPVLLQTLRVPSRDTISRVRMPGNFDLEVDVTGNLLLVVAGGRLAVMLVTNLDKVQNIITLCTDAECSESDAVHVDRDGPFAVVSGGDITVFNVAVVARTFRIRHVETPGTARGAAVKGRIAFIADGGAGLTVVRIQ